MRIGEDIVGLIGRTPLLRMKHLSPAGGADVYAKCEFMNPISVKDRAVLCMLTGARERGEITTGDTVVEATSGNTGMALAFIGGAMGLRVVLCMSEIQSVERRMTLAALGAGLVLTPQELGTKGAKEKALEIAASTGAYYLCQHDNPDNRRAHREGTGPEIWEQTGGKIDIFIAALGTCGTITGVAEAIKPRKKDFCVIGVEPTEAPMISRGEFRPHRMMGTSPGFIPGLLNRDLIDEIVTVSEAAAFAACRDIAEKAGVLTGISSGATAHAAALVAARPENKGKTVVCVFADRGERYLSVEGLFARTR